MGSAAPGRVVLGCVRKQTEQTNHGEGASKQHSSITSVLVPTSRFLLELLSLAVLDGEL